MIHSASPQSRFSFHFEKLKLTDNLCENSDHYRQGRGRPRGSTSEKSHTWSTRPVHNPGWQWFSSDLKSWDGRTDSRTTCVITISRDWLFMTSTSIFSNSFSVKAPLECFWTLVTQTIGESTTFPNLSVTWSEVNHTYWKWDRLIQQHLWIRIIN